MKSFGLLRTNVGLTTNIKIMVDSSYNLSLDSIDSKAELSTNSLKKVTFNKKNYWDELIKYFFNGIPADTAYHIKHDDDEDNMWSDFANQYDEIYQYGARNISNNKNYKEEFEYFAPLYINKGNLPKYFIIFRIDGPGVITSNKGNFRGEVLQKLKTVKIFDLSKKTNLGEWLEINFSKNNNFFPNAPLEIDFRNLEFCRWNGINFESGGYVSNSLFIDDILDEEKEIFGLEKFVFDKFKELKVVCANILNFSFLFDDEPATPEFKRKWSINRYLGFYLEEIELVRTLSPYITPFLHPDTVILANNILYSATNAVPFVEGWSDARPFYVEYLGNYYIVQKITENTGKKLVRKPSSLSGRRNNIRYAVEEFENTTATRYKIISELDLTGKQNLINKNFGYINTGSILEDYNNNPLVINEFDDADVWLIEIDGIYHNLSKTRNSSIQIVSDYLFQYDINSYSYTVAGETKKVSTMVDFNNPPKKWSIYKLKFSDIKDFDDRIVDTEFSKFEYEKVSEITDTDEPKLYFENLNSGTNPPVLDDFIYKGQVENIPVSSEYTANHETFKIEENTLTRLWRKNSVHCRWVYKNSISGNDYPYLLNNSAVLDDYNRTTNTYEVSPIRSERNLDYFYTVNLQNTSYLNHSLHVCSYTGSSIDNTFTFDLKKYLNLATYSVGTSSATYSFDYFSHFFERKEFFANSKISKNSKKYSIVNVGDKSIPNITLFKGIKFLVYDVDSIKLSETGDLDLNLKNSNTFEDYKFSILLSDNDWSVNDSGQVVQSTNLMNWTIIDEWKMDKTYPVGTIGIFDDILYISQIESRIELPVVTRNSREIKSAPHNVRSNTNVPEWQIYNNDYSIFWNPTKTTYDSSDLDPEQKYNYIVYNSGEYYRYNNSGTEDFWNPEISESVGYSLGTVVLYKNQYYMSMTSSNNYAPDFEQSIRVSGTWNKVWAATQSTNPKWSEIELWNPSLKYLVDSIVVHNDVVYIYKQTSNTPAPIGIEPQNSSWTRLYSIEPDTNHIYQNSDNPIIRMNNKYYMINSNSLNSTLDNGIIIYINKKWKNILVNINVADNTTQYINGVERDYLYTDLNRKFTANNFILAINDIRNKYDFTDYVTYVIIDESGNITKHRYDLNLTTLKHMIVCETAEDLDIKVDSLHVTPIQMTGDLKALKTLQDGNIKDITYLNYYNNTAIACRIDENKFRPKVFENYHGNKNITKNRIYRFSGEYTPLFYDIELFEKSWEKSTTGNYKFDTSLSNFGIMRERRISKINRKESKLKLKDSGEDKPIYPMLDEFGYTTTDFYIFSSTWDLAYHLETSPNENILKDIREFIPADVKNSFISLGEISLDGKQVKLVEEIGQPPINNNSKNQDSQDSQL